MDRTLRGKSLHFSCPLFSGPSASPSFFESFVEQRTENRVEAPSLTGVASHPCFVGCLVLKTENSQVKSNMLAPVFNSVPLWSNEWQKQLQQNVMAHSFRGSQSIAQERHSRRLCTGQWEPEAMAVHTVVDEEHEWSQK